MTQAWLPSNVWLANASIWANGSVGMTPSCLGPDGSHRRQRKTNH